MIIAATKTSEAHHEAPEILGENEKSRNNKNFEALVS